MPRPIIEGKRQAKVKVSMDLKTELANALRQEARTKRMYFNEFIEYLYNFYLDARVKK